MISVNLAYNGYVGLSTDTKPIEDVNNGSRFYEMDTQKNYMFNAEGAEWIEQTAEGGGGADGGYVVPIHISMDEYTGVVTLDKTFAEIKALIQEGKFLYIPSSEWDCSLTVAFYQEDTGEIDFASPFNCSASTGNSRKVAIFSDNSVISYNTQITASTHEDGD